MSGQGIKGLNVFSQIGDGLPQGDEIATVLQSSSVKKVICCSLGPEGTNIAQASRRWLRRMGIADKSEVRLGETPYTCLAEARSIQDSGVVAVFWTCAVYNEESKFFFSNPDVYPFYVQEPMPLDSMQLATRHELCLHIIGGEIPKQWRISSHPSPQYLVNPLGCEIIIVNSNAVAAQHCAEGKSEACITTEEARKIHDLKTLHVFGSPLMIFFGGITQHGAEVLKKGRILSSAKIL